MNIEQIRNVKQRYWLSMDCIEIEICDIWFLVKTGEISNVCRASSKFIFGQK